MLGIARGGPVVLVFRIAPATYVDVPIYQHLCWWHPCAHAGTAGPGGGQSQATCISHRQLPDDVLGDVVKWPVEEQRGQRADEAAGIIAAPRNQQLVAAAAAASPY